MMATIDGVPEPERISARAATGLAAAYEAHNASLVRLAAVLLDDVETCAHRGLAALAAALEDRA